MRKRQKNKKDRDIKVSGDYFLLAHSGCFHHALKRLLSREHEIMTSWAIDGDDGRAILAMEDLAGKTWNLAERCKKPC